jgi:hypothetical protein
MLKKTNADLAFCMLILLLRLLFPLIAYDIIVWSSDRLIISTGGERGRETHNEGEDRTRKKRIYLDYIKLRKNIVSHG